MATKQGPRFGDDKPVQRNKENTPGAKPNRSPGQSNAARAMPSLKEDVAKSVKADASRVGKGLSSSGKSALTRSAQQQAGGRALSRMAGRAGYAGLAANLGWEAGKAIDEKTGIGKKIVDKTVGPMIDKAVGKGGVKLSQDSKDRLAKMKKDENTASQKSRSETRMADVKAKAPAKTSTAKGGLSPFGKAFREARAAGKKEFSFGGKKYNTKLK